MARPRFAPTSRRPQVGVAPPVPFQPQSTTPSRSGGFQLQSRPGQIGGGFQLQSPTPIQSTLQQRRLDAINNADIPDWVKTDLEKKVLGGVTSRYHRPISVLSGIARILGVGENFMVGALQGAVDDVRNIKRGDVPWALISPWTYIAAHSPDNFVEIKDAVAQNRTYEQWLQESQDPGSFLYDNAFVIGLGLSIFGDPTTYVSFGATAAGKTAAQKALFLSYTSTVDEVQTAMRVGKLARTGEDVSGKTYSELFAAVHTGAERPWTIGDAMNWVKKADQGKVPDMDPRLLDELGIKSRGPVRSVLRKRFARGGQGIRFGGAEIPGTVGLGGKIGKQAQRIPGVPSREGLLEGFSLLIPDEKLLRLTEDVTRTSAMIEFTRANQAMAMAKSGALEDAIEHFALDPIKAARATRQPGLARAAVAIRNIFHEDPLAVPKADRMGLFKPGTTPTGTFKLPLQDMKTKALRTRDDLLAQAEDLGMDQGQLKGLLHLWDDYVKNFDDPVDVLARWQATVTGNIAGKQLIDQLVRNPLLARPIIRGAEDIAKLEGDMLDINQRLARATKRVAEKGISSRSKNMRLTTVAKLTDESKQLASQYNRLSDELKLSQPVGAALRSDEEFRAIFDETAIPFRWRGVEYLVPAPIEQALEQIRNPQLIDKEIRKAFRAMNFTQNKWKMLVTSMNPSFWWMNLVGGMWNNMLGGVYNPADYTQQFTAMMRDRLARTDEDSLAAKVLGPLKDRINPEKLARDQELMGAFEARHAGGGFISHEIHPAYQELKRTANIKGSKRKAFTAARRAYVGTVIPLTVAPDEWVPDEIEDNPLFNPMAALVAGLPEFARAGRYITQDVETVLRATPMRVAAKDPSYYQLMDALSVAPPVNFGRWMDQTDIGKTKFMKEAVWDIGAANAIRYQFDYTNLTNFERFIAKTVFPFYVFNKNNFVLQAQEVVNRPRFLATMVDVGNFANYITANEQNEGFQELLPEYFDKLGMFRIPVPGAFRDILGLPADQDVYLNPKLPYASLNLFPPLWEIFNDQSVTPGNNRWLQMMAPLFGAIGPASIIPGWKPMLEYSVGYNLGLARPIDYQVLESGGYRNSYREAPSFMRFVPKPLQNLFGAYKDPKTGALMMSASKRYIAEQMATGFMSSSGDVFNWGASGPEADRVRANSFSFLSGIRLTPVDPLKVERGWLYRMQSFLEGQKGNAKKRGEPFANEDELFLRQLRAQIRVIEQAYDEKQKAMYGG